MRIIALTTLAFVAFVSTASAQNVEPEILTLDGNVVVVPTKAKLDSFVEKCNGVARPDDKVSCKADFGQQRRLWELFTMATKHASLASVVNDDTEVAYGLGKARSYYAAIRSHEANLKQHWPELYR